MSDDIIWALDQRERCIACPSKPLANAVVLYLGEDGALPRSAVEAWAGAGVMAAGIVWPGADAHLDEDDWADLEDAVTGLAGLASVVAVVGEGAAGRLAERLVEGVGGCALLVTGDMASESLVKQLGGIETHDFLKCGKNNVR